MSSLISLPTIIRRVPVCCQDITVDELWSVFSEGDHDCVVVVNQDQYPIGVVYLHSLTTYLFSPKNKKQPLTKVILADLSDRLIKPLLLIPAYLDWPEFLASLQQIGYDLGWHPHHSSNDHKIEGLPALAIINQNQEFLGLIDLAKLLPYIVSQPVQFPKYQSSVQKGGFDSFLGSLLQLLDQLPLPMMIQTQNGEILGQNRAWVQQVGNEPEVLQQAAETVNQWVTTPTTTDVGISSQSNHSTMASSPPESSISQTTAVNLNTTQFGECTPDIPNWCDSGSNGETYICICPQSKQQRVWQFTRRTLVQPSLTECFDKWWLIIAQDITEQYRVAQELTAKNADLIQLNRLKDEFLACISHELKTPLTAVLGLSSLLKDKALGELSDRQAKYAKLIHQSGRHLMMVVNDILDLTRIETGQLELTPEGVNIKTVCDRALEAVLHLHQQGDIKDSQSSLGSQKFSIEIEPGLETIEADELRLRQMLINLISNAFKFTPDGGYMGLRVNRWEDWVVFTVWDTGIGIPEQKQHLIFEKFQQLESPLNRQFEGTGLGLVLCQRLARLHGGDISFISHQRKGTEFTLLLPPVPPVNGWKSDKLDWEKADVYPSSPYPKTNLSRPTTQGQSRLILIVEAVPKYIDDLSDKLTKLGYRAIVARTGTEALEKARRLQPRMIFLNPLLPLLSGWDVLTLLKTDVDTSEIPVFITATLGDKKRSLKTASDGFLSLPVQKSDLQLVINKLEKTPSTVPLKTLTVLWLNPVDHELNQGLAENFHPPTTHDTSQTSHCRILEADDLGQAELLARIWHPNVMVLESINHLDDPMAFLLELKDEKHLANLPIVTLDTPTTQAANQIKGLSVFPCLLPQISQTSMGSRRRQADPGLLQVIQVAAGISWKSHILVVDLLTLPDLVNVDSQGNNQTANFYPPADRTSKIEQALIQYLQKAGFRGTMGRTWEEIMQQLQFESVDLLLFCVRQQTFPILRNALEALVNLGNSQRDDLTIPPILVLDNSGLFNSSSDTNANSYPIQHIPTDLQGLTQNLTLKFLSGRISMTELLDQIRELM
ncbi:MULTISPECIES: ATP-binding protein [Limnospira]|mgnify:CR=1 FL=1|uniref:histidine kinase n=1 Tax=Limnospira platensis NIES-46 TaxID=1236695 RepID=A0A5M3TBK1_LIMPL|nr:ATP-binding protein [Arthrospira platensis]MDF2207542.1 ATP-binding protein [Arthrospira platensis NCB002]MDT9182044.1 ATP-binding protein [Limnospira sp. PMC 289.06]BAI93204.1 two-component hybrid sensor and regulator [Arthrospira platensis NIES-39]BDT15447.1 two-component hybrid sensor and regulator [Arthrospira platensis NIES-39]GCE96052.1 two-component hybrid sensor and regulator [Arthrospira platensis NIES-46]